MKDMLHNWRKESEVRRVLNGLKRQRVAAVMQPGSVWVIEMALQRDEATEAALMTCLMRGWVEPLFDDLPTGEVGRFLANPKGPLFTGSTTVFRLTDGGWNAINRAHTWVLVGVVLALLSLVVALTASWPTKPQAGVPMASLSVERAIGAERVPRPSSRQGGTAPLRPCQSLPPAPCR